MLSCSLCEPELKLIGSAASVGCVTSSAYFESIDRPENLGFVARWKARHGTDNHVSVDGLSTYVCVMLLARAIGAPARLMSPPSGAPPQTTATNRPRARSGSIPKTTTAS